LCAAAIAAASELRALAFVFDDWSMTFASDDER
jgi:hypothetical protein